MGWRGIGKNKVLDTTKMQQYWEILKGRFLRGNIVQRLIYINIAIFLSRYVVRVFSFLLGFDENIYYEYGSLDASFSALLQKPWSIITYGFLHADFLHLLINMTVLFFIGELFLGYFTQKQLLNFYLLGTFFGGCIYLISYEFLLSFQNNTLLGASAGIMAIFAGIATYLPHTPIKIPLLGKVKLWVLAAVFVGFDFISIPLENTGGHLAHLGGAFFGFLTVKYPTIKIKIPLRKSPKKSYRKKTDQILEKIKNSGYESLTRDEKHFLFQQGKK